MTDRNNEAEKNVQLINAIQAELKKSKPLFQTIASMVSNESTLKRRTLNDIDESIEHLRNISAFAKSNREQIDRKVVNAVSDFCSDTIRFYEESKELHYIHGTEKGANRRSKSAKYIEKEVKPALENYKSSRNKLTEVLRNHNPD